MREATSGILQNLVITRIKMVLVGCKIGEFDVVEGLAEESAKGLE